LGISAIWPPYLAG